MKGFDLSGINVEEVKVIQGCRVEDFELGPRKSSSRTLISRVSINDGSVWVLLMDDEGDRDRLGFRL